MTTPSAPLTPEQQPAAPAKKGGALLKKVGGIVVAIIVAVAVKVGLPHLTGDAPVHAEAGECVTVTGPDNEPKVDTADCSSGKADLFKVVKVVDDTFDVEKCADAGEMALAQQLNSDKFVLCLDKVAK
ncbi:LppU/SCO3897 family protein [Streptomyces tanashiensis]